MNPRRFDGLTRRLSLTAPATSRRQLLGALPALAALTVLPRGVRAFDGGAPVAPVGGAAPCTSGADCAPGDVCVNGGCQPLTTVSSGQPAAGGELPVAAETTPVPGVATVEAPPTTAAPAAATTAAGQTPAAVGGEVAPTQPLAARIYTGTCGNLGADAAFQLIDIGPLGGANGQAPAVGSTVAIPARASTTVLNTTLNDLVGSDHSVDVRTDAADPATSVACGAIGGRLGGQIAGTELAIGLRERNASGNAGIAWFREENSRTVVDVFVAQGLQEGAAIGGVLAPPAQTTTQEQAAPTPTATVIETPTSEQAALTPTVTVIQTPTPTSGTAAQTQTAATPTAAVNYQIGDHLVTTTDVNLRAAPNTDAAVVTILGAGQELEVTGAPQGDWIPVRDVATGRRGFVSAEFVQPVTA